MRRRHSSFKASPSKGATTGRGTAMVNAAFPPPGKETTSARFARNDPCQSNRRWLSRTLRAGPGLATTTVSMRPLRRIARICGWSPGAAASTAAKSGARFSQTIESGRGCHVTGSRSAGHLVFAVPTVFPTLVPFLFHGRVELAAQERARPLQRIHVRGPGDHIAALHQGRPAVVPPQEHLGVGSGRQRLARHEQPLGNVGGQRWVLGHDPPGVRP